MSEIPSADELQDMSSKDAWECAVNVLRPEIDTLREQLAFCKKAYVEMHDGVEKLNDIFQKHVAATSGTR